MSSVFQTVTDPWGPATPPSRIRGWSKRRNVPVIAAGFLLYDTFTAVSNQVLTAHTMNIGPGWTVSGGTFQVTANANLCIETANSGSRDFAYADSTKTDVTVVCSLIMGSTKTAGIDLRLTDKTHNWSLETTQGSPGSVKIREWQGTATDRATASLTVDTSSHVWKFVASGTTVTGYFDGTQEVTYASASSNSTATKCGIHSAAVSAAQFSNFQVTSP